jgi:hypothetical protein
MATEDADTEKCSRTSVTCYRMIRGGVFEGAYFSFSAFAPEGMR